MDWGQIFKQAVEGILVVVVPVLGTIIGMILKEYLTSIKDKKYYGVVYKAVLFAEDKGEKKLENAVAYIMERAGVAQATAEADARAMYQNIYKQVPVPNGSTPSPTQ